MQRLEVSGAVRPIYGSLGVKRLTQYLISHRHPLVYLEDTHKIFVRNFGIYQTTWCRIQDREIFFLNRVIISELLQSVVNVILIFLLYYIRLFEISSVLQSTQNVYTRNLNLQIKNEH